VTTMVALYTRREIWIWALALLAIAAALPPVASAIPPAGIQYTPAVPSAGGPVTPVRPPQPRAHYLPRVARALVEPNAFAPGDAWALRLIGTSAALGAPARSGKGESTAGSPSVDSPLPGLPTAVAGSIDRPDTPLVLVLLAAIAASLTAIAVRRRAVRSQASTRPGSPG
jgi:hypothetical protein